MEANHELGLRLQDLLKSIRLMKQSRPGMPAGMLGVLAQIDQLSTGCHARELAAKTALDPSTISRAVASLVTHGLVERRPDPDDGRASVLVLTEAGRAALDDSFDWYGRVLDQALAGWTVEEVEALGAIVGRFAGDLENFLTTHNLEAAR